MNHKITINLPNGDQLVAEDCTFSEGGQIAVGIVHDGTWIQDLAVIEAKLDNDGKYIEDKFNIYTYADEYSEDYTDKIEVNRVPDDAL